MLNIERTLPTHDTCSMYLLDRSETEILLVKHNKLGIWLPPGGHIDSGENPVTAVTRELKEEVHVNLFEFIDLPLRSYVSLDSDEQRLLSADEVTTELTKRDLPILPRLLVKEYIAEHKKEPEHFHIDYVFLGKTDKEDVVTIQEEEVADAQWFTLNEEMIGDLNTFKNVKAILKGIVSSVESSKATK